MKKVLLKSKQTATVLYEGSSKRIVLAQCRKLYKSSSLAEISTIAIVDCSRQGGPG